MMMEDDKLNVYREDEDINNEVNNNDDFNSNHLTKMINEELAEPELVNYCKGNKRALDMIKLCISFSNKKEWNSMIEYLSNLSENLIFENLLNEELPMFFVSNFYLGVSYFKVSQYEKALTCFFEAIKVYSYYQINYNIALCYIKLDNLDHAKFYLYEVVKSNKNFFFSYYNLIRINLKTNNISDAYLMYKDFSDMIKKDKDNQKTGLIGQNRLSVASFNALKLFYKLGAECCFSKCLYQECVLTILEALKFNPEDPDLWCLYAKVFIMKKAFEYAITLLEKVLSINPYHIEAKDLLETLKNELNTD